MACITQQPYHHHRQYERSLLSPRADRTRVQSSSAHPTPAAAHPKGTLAASRARARQATHPQQLVQSRSESHCSQWRHHQQPIMHACSHTQPRAAAHHKHVAIAASARNPIQASRQTPSTASPRCHYYRCGASLLLTLAPWCSHRHAHHLPHCHNHGPRTMPDPSTEDWWCSE